MDDHDDEQFRLMLPDEETVPDDDTILNASLLFDGARIHTIVQ